MCFNQNFITTRVLVIPKNRFKGDKTKKTNTEV